MVHQDKMNHLVDDSLFSLQVVCLKGDNIIVSRNCAVLEKIHNSLLCQGRSLKIPGVGEGYPKPKLLKESMNRPNGNFRGVGEVKLKTYHGKGMDIFKSSPLNIYCGWDRFRKYK